MKNILLYCFVFTSLINASYAQTNLSVKEKYELKQAHRAFNAGDYTSAVRIYRSLLNNHTEDAKLNYHLGKSYLAMNMVNDSKMYFDEVAELNTELENEFYLDYGRIHLLNGDYKRALVNFNAYKSKTNKDSEIIESGVDGLIAECNYAIKNIENPVKVRVVALSDSVNSEYSDGVPSVTADGKTIVYTSRRPINKGGEVDIDGQHFQDIYMASWNEKLNSWGEGRPLEGAINTNGHDAATSISPDGEFIYVYQNLGVIDNRNNAGAGDILVSKKGSTERWSRPKMIEGVNSTWFETSGCVSPDGQTMYFISERIRGGNGNGDIWMSERIDKNEWSKPINLGNVINTPEDEVSVYIHPDGKTLFFASKGHQDQNYGGYDIFKTVRGEEGTWSTPVNLGYPINTFRDERHFVMTTDGKVGYFTGQRDDKRIDADIYMIDFSHYDVMTGESSEIEKITILKGMIKDMHTARAISADVIIKNTSTGEEFNLKSDESGEYFNTLKANQEYEINISKEGYNSYTQKFILPGGEWDETITYENNIEIDRITPIEVVDKSLFQVQTIMFKVENTYDLDTETCEQLDLYVEQLEKVESLKLHITGHGNNMGQENENKQSALKRAEAIEKYLKTKGVNSNRLIVDEQGSSMPIADGSTETGQALNRRVEIRIFE